MPRVFVLKDRWRRDREFLGNGTLLFDVKPFLENIYERQKIVPGIAEK
jgi:hypothetical protein